MSSTKMSMARLILCSLASTPATPHLLSLLQIIGNSQCAHSRVAYLLPIPLPSSGLLCRVGRHQSLQLWFPCSAGCSYLVEERNKPGTSLLYSLPAAWRIQLWVDRPAMVQLPLTGDIVFTPQSWAGVTFCCCESLHSPVWFLSSFINQQISFLH
jgi:hypothetical protein